MADAIDAYSRRAYGRELTPAGGPGHRPLLAAGYGASRLATERSTPWTCA